MNALEVGTANSQMYIRLCDWLCVYHVRLFWTLFRSLMS
jgi:hypothetical protein